MFLKPHEKKFETIREILPNGPPATLESTVCRLYLETPSGLDPTLTGAPGAQLPASDPPDHWVTITRCFQIMVLHYASYIIYPDSIAELYNVITGSENLLARL